MHSASGFVAMSRLMHGAVDENQDFVGDNDENSSSNEEYDDEDVWISDCESSTGVKRNVDSTEIKPIIGVDESDRMNCVTVGESDDLQSRLIRLNESDEFYQKVKNRFVSGMKEFGVTVQLEHIRGFRFLASAITRARLQTFIIYTKAVSDKNCGSAVIRHGWYGTSKEEINKILLHGFCHDHIKKDGDFGYGLYLSTDKSIIESLKSTTIDDDGLRHVLLCRVLMGKSEVVKHGSRQFHPSSDEFQSGVDSLESPKKLIVWSTNLNTHILPEYVISFKTVNRPNDSAIKKVQCDASLTRSMSIKALISRLSNDLPLEAVKKINEYHHNYIEHKISRHDMLIGFRDLAGERPLLLAVKEYKEQQILKQGKVMGSNNNVVVSSK